MSKIIGLPQLAKSGLCDWLDSKDWDTWTTLTTKYELTLPGARRSMIRFQRLTDKIAPSSVFWVAEQFDCKDGFHLHSLWNFGGAISNKTNYSLFKEAWKTSANNDKAFCYSERYRKSKGAHSYLAKYITKGITDYDYFDSRSPNRELLGNDVMQISKIVKRSQSKRKIIQQCKKAFVQYEDVMNEWKEEVKENRIWYNDLEKEQKEIYGY